MGGGGNSIKTVFVYLGGGGEGATLSKLFLSTFYKRSSYSERKFFHFIVIVIVLL